MKATAQANANIALVKYWGKRDEKLILPQNSSISMTCSGLTTTTTVEFSNNYKSDSIKIDGKDAGDKNIVEHLDRIRKLAGIKDRARIVSKSNFPAAAGLASSASGFAALTLAASRAAGLQLDSKELSILARMGSGSASRSVCEGFAIWHRGSRPDGRDSYAESIVKKNHWPQFRMLTAIVTEAKKATSSRAGMAQSVRTSPFYASWVAGIGEDLKKTEDAIKRRDFHTVGSVAEANCVKMHALMMTTKPAIVYWQPATLEVIHAVEQWRSEGMGAYFTIDAGPNVKVMCLEKDADEIKKRLQKLSGVKKVIICEPGDGARLLTRHLF